VVVTGQFRSNGVLSIMKILVQSRALMALAVIAFAGSATPAFAEIVYKVTNYSAGQDGWSLNGTLTLSGTGTFINGSGLESWHLTLKKGATIHELTDTQAEAVFDAVGTLTATSENLLLAADSRLAIGTVGSLDDGSIRWVNHTSSVSNYYSMEWGAQQLGWYTRNYSPTDGSSWIIGTAVPEIDPATGGSALSLVAGVLAMIEQRRRRATLVA